MAQSMGIDPASNKYVPMNLTLKKYVTNWFDLVLDYVGELDFWWLDWQQEHYTDMVNLNPTFWLNYLFTTRFQQVKSQQRPLILHRYVFMRRSEA
jgi:alpha-glucosidase